MISDSKRPVVSVDDVLITAELASRPSRAADHAAESRALVGLAIAMVDSPHGVFQKLADTALELCRAGSAGISVWEPGKDADAFRWCAVAGDYSQYMNATLPRNFSPCGTVLDRNTSLLMADPIRFFPYIGDLQSPVREVLLVPFYQGDEPVGTVWVVAHQEERKFDSEDLRLLTSLTKFAGAAVLVLNRTEAAERAERIQRERETQFRALALATSDVVYRMSPDWTEMQPLDGRGLVARNDEPIRDWMRKNIPECEHGRINDAIRVAVTTRQMFELEHQVIRADGSIGWTFSRAIPLLGADGEILEWFGAAGDVTRRKSAESDLSDIRSRMETSLEVGAIGTWSWDVQADRFFGDGSLARLFNVATADVSGGPLSRLMNSIHPEDRERVALEVAQAVTHCSRYESDYRLLQPDGSVRWVTARGKVEPNEAGLAVRFPGVVVDITERKRVEAELARVTAESERRKRLYEAVLSGTPDFVYVFSLDHRILYANDALIAMWGYPLSETIGKTFLEVGYEAWHAEMHCREIDQVRATKQPVRGEVPFHGTFGRRIYEYIFVPVLGPGGDVEAVAGTTRDVTDRKGMEDELREADRKKDDFIALLAHELRNPLAPIRNGLQVMRLAGDDVSVIASTRTIMERQLGHMVRLIDDLLDISRLSRNKMELRRGKTLLADIVESAVEVVRPLADAAGHTLSVELPPGPVFLDADLTRLGQVFGNLLNNSVKYTPPGGRIHVRAELIHGEVIVTVRDNGIGIPSEFLPRIFDMFSQVDRSIERSTGGLGIGLALVKGLVEMHDGTVSAASDGPSLGSVFTIRLPTIDGLATPDKTGGEIAGRPKRRLLVVDDNRDGASSLATMLRLLGDEVRTAHDGVEAVDAAEEFRPEVILMDVGMPRLNGLDAARQIKAEPWGEGITIIALTGWGQDHDRQRSFEAGCDDHMIKPVDVAELQRKLAAMTPS